MSKELFIIIAPPLFAGIGWAVTLIAFYTDFYYNVVISWGLYYLFASFKRILPWSECSMLNYSIEIYSNRFHFIL